RPADGHAAGALVDQAHAELADKHTLWSGHRKGGGGVLEYVAAHAATAAAQDQSVVHTSAVDGKHPAAVRPDAGSGDAEVGAGDGERPAGHIVIAGGSGVDAHVQRGRRQSAGALVERAASVVADGDVGRAEHATGGECAGAGGLVADIEIGDG